MSTIESFEPLYRRRSLEAAALAACRGRVLNAGAAAGRHSLLLHENGHELVSVDVDPRLVDLMRRRGLEHVHQGDIFDFDRGMFDTILFLAATIGVAGSLDRLGDLLARLKTRLTPGEILLDSQSPRSRRSLGYAGEMEMQLQYGWLLGRPFRWLYVDFSVLKTCARGAGYDVEVLTQGHAAWDFLARLTPRPGQ